MSNYDSQQIVNKAWNFADDLQTALEQFTAIAEKVRA